MREFVALDNNHLLFIHKIKFDYSRRQYGLQAMIISVCGYVLDQKGLILTLDDDYVNCPSCISRR